MGIKTERTLKEHSTSKGTSTRTLNKKNTRGLLESLKPKTRGKIQFTSKMTLRQQQHAASQQTRLFLANH